MDHAVLGRRGEPRAPVADVVRVRAGEDGRKSAPLGERRELVVELRLAVVAAVAAVRAVALALELGGRDRLVCDADRAGDVTRTVELTRRERGRHGRHGERSLPERAHGERGDERRVDAARERDDTALRVSGSWPRAARMSSWRLGRGRAPRPTPTLRSGPVDLASAAQSSCSGATLTTRPSRSPTFTRTVPPRQLDGPLLAVELVAVEPRHADAERARLLEQDARDLALRLGTREHGEHEARDGPSSSARARSRRRALPPRSSARPRPGRAPAGSRRGSSRGGRPDPSAAPTSAPRRTRTTFGRSGSSFVPAP